MGKGESDISPIGGEDPSAMLDYADSILLAERMLAAKEQRTAKFRSLMMSALGSMRFSATGLPYLPYLERPNDENAP